MASPAQPPKSPHAVIGIDLGGPKTLCALFDKDFRLIAEMKFETAPEKGEKRFTRQLTLAVNRLKRAGGS